MLANFFRKLRNLVQSKDAALVLLAIFSSAAFLLLTNTSLVRVVNEELARRFEFYCRDKFNKNPLLSQQIKIVAYDDVTAQRYGSEARLSAENWVKLFNLISVANPKAILIDKLFARFDSDAETQVFADGLSKLKTPIYGGATVFKEQVIGWKPLANNLYLANLNSDAASNFDRAEFISGPDPRVSKSFTASGHLVLDANGLIKSSFVNPEGKFIPPLSLIWNKGIVASLLSDENRMVPTDDKNRIIPNLSNRASYWNKSYSVVSILDEGGSKLIADNFKENDVVFVLPNMFTGNVDFKTTYMGSMEGGFLHVAIANSAVTNQWITPVATQLWLQMLFVIIACNLAIFLVWQFSIRIGYLIISIVALGIILGDLAVFTFFGLSFALLMPIISLVCTGAAAIAVKAFILDRQGQRVASALEGLVSPGLLKTLMLNPDQVSLSPMEIYVSIMFIDIEGFSLRAEIRKPMDVFCELREQFKHISAIIHSHGGIIDKTLGDGLLCYFGFSYGDTQAKSATLHAYDSVMCAIEIQRYCAEMAVSVSDESVGQGPKQGETSHLLPMRIGINTGIVFFGNLGAGSRLDYTLIGDAVNFAKRLEDASETFRMMLGSQTKQLLCEHLGVPLDADLILPYNSAVKRRYVRIKHHQELVEGWECNPFSGESEEFINTLAAIRKKITRNSQRLTVPEDLKIEVLINRTYTGFLKNFSLSGLCFESKEYFARKLSVTVEFAPSDPILREVCVQAGLLPLICEVRWGVSSVGVCKHGVQIGDLDPERRELLLKIIQDTLMRKAGV